VERSEVGVKGSKGGREWAGCGSAQAHTKVATAAAKTLGYMHAQLMLVLSHVLNASSPLDAFIDTS
jgi:hypothetical protein